ncbi:MAG: Asp-tRNA(Asn)/Glu-tRNA(Gln) amidotransferase subunit GatC [Candidatus Saccharibacteria bacterium]|nr:Asp-tRNA(Asn)/Glu-tRNA(Gln) amidotransferase subunit GatC [Candidatus Saccharibacteria bacterium]
MANLTENDVLKLASLSKISLDKEELTALTTELGDILGYIEQLSSVDVSGLEPINQVTGLTNVMRKDVITDYGVSQEELLKNLPARSGNYMKVNKVL